MSAHEELLRESLQAIERLQAQLKAAERAQREPIAILGAGCRLPGGADSLQQLWQLLRDGVDAIEEVPSERWQIDASKRGELAQHGGFLRGIDRFDADFFGISPREAAVLDPQQRLLLEVSLEALENAAQPIDRLVGSNTGVYVGISTSDYGQKMGVGRSDSNDIHCITGTALNAAAGRIAFNFGFQGPSIAVDTACSSSAVAIHLACQSLRGHECEQALAGATNVILLPGLVALLSKWGALSKTGRCRSFDASADGFVRAEGCAVIVLKRLSDALAAGDPIIGVIRGSAINSDGRSSGLTVPNGLAQQAVLRNALANAGLVAADIGYVEAHGTGTPLGDPIEIEALDAVFCQHREQPLRVGSIKTNLGHGETTAGIAGVLKVLLALQHEAIPGNLHLTRPSPSIPWARLNIEIPTRLTPWPRGVQPRRAGVSSFGLSGTNAHIVLEEVPAAHAMHACADADDYLIALSARSPAALSDLAQRYANFLQQPGVNLPDISRTSLLGRAAYSYRAAVVAGTVEQAVRSLAQLPDAARVGNGQRTQVAFMYPGQGAQWTGMLLQLSASEPAVRQALRQCEAAFATELDVPLSELLGRADLLMQTRYTQPALFAVEWILSQYWSALGMQPIALIGHSIGEYVAACVAGVMDMPDAARLVAARGRLMQTRCAPGAMLAVLAGECAVMTAIKQLALDIDLAAVNAADNVVVSGEAAAIGTLEQHLTAVGMRSQRLAVSQAFHSRLLTPMLAEFAEVAAAIRMRPPRLALYSNLHGARAGAEMTDAAYWVRHAREPVRFRDGATALLREQTALLLEVGPGTTLGGLVRREHQAAAPGVLATLRAGQSERRSIAHAVAELWRAGVSVNMERFLESRGGRRIAMPSYPFQRERHWVDNDMSAQRPALPHPEWLYQQEWRPIADAPPATRGPQHWLLIGHGNGNGDGFAFRFAEHLRVRGERCTVLQADFAEDAAALRAGAAPLHIVYCLGVEESSAALLDAAALMQFQQRLCGSLLNLAQSLARVADASATRLTVLTRRAVHVPGDTAAMAIAVAPLVALARAIGLELPRLHSACIDLDAEPIDLDAVHATLAAPRDENLMALRGRTRWVARLARMAAPAVAARSVIEADATYLISGGLGALGLRVAQRFIEQGARHLLLLGRRAASPAVAEVVAGLRKTGAEIRIEPIDVGDGPAVQSVFDQMRHSMPPLRGIVHAAGVLDDGVLEQQSWARFARVMHPKLAGAWNLHASSLALPLRFFVLFSSAAALLGSVGQANYCTANAFLDALAQHRRQRGLPAVSIGWGGWAESGMAASQDPRRGDGRTGVRLLEPRPALDTLQGLLAGAPPCVGVVNVDWPVLLGHWTPGPATSLFADFTAEQPVAAQTPALLSDLLRAAQPGSEPDVILDYVRHCIGAVLRRDAGRIEPDVPLLELGLDSLLAIELRNRIENTGGPALKLTRFIDGADARRIATLIAERLPVAQAATALPTTDAALAELVASMSDAEIESQLARLGQGPGA